LAQLSLGMMFVAGEGIPQDYGQAAVWLRKAADQGNSEAQHALGVLYDNGQGVPSAPPPPSSPLPRLFPYLAAFIPNAGRLLGRRTAKKRQ
jgi:Sel1 repeat